MASWLACSFTLRFEQCGKTEISAFLRSECRFRKVVLMAQLTERQLEYLLVFSTRDGEKKSISEAAELLGVSKPTAFSVTEALAAQNMIIKGEHGEVRLTEEGWTFLGDKPRQFDKLFEWMTVGLGLTPAYAEHQARKMVATLDGGAIGAIIADWECPIEQKTDCFLSDRAPGGYAVPFRVCKKDTDDISMGDRGFSKPAGVVRTKNRSFIYLEPKEIEYKAGKRKRMLGRLDRLWYRLGNSWCEAEEGKNHSFMLPGAAVFYRERKGRKIGVLRIRARASVGMLGMPESEADVTFLLDQTKQMEASENQLMQENHEEDTIQ